MSEKRTSTETTKKAKLSKLHIALIIVASVLIIAFAVVSYFAISYDKIFSGVSVCETDLGTLSAEDAVLILEENFSDISPEIRINFNGEVISLSFRDFGEYDFETSANNAASYGKGNFFAKFFTYSTPFVNRNLPMEFFIDEDAVTKFLHTEYSKFGTSYVDTSYEIKDDKLLITAGHSGNTLNTEEIINQMKEGISTGSDIEIDAVIVHKDYVGVDIDSIYKEISGKPENAYYDKENGKIVPHKSGYKFDKNAAKNQVKDITEDEVVEISLIVEDPEITEAVLTAQMFEDVIISYTTKYKTAEVDRTYNMQLAGARVNGTVLAPGEVFSYNDVVGERTVSKGYRNAKIFENGRVVDGLAGGICQVSTTIYNAALYSNMEIVERKNHSFPVSYAPMGQDATVVMGAIDFKFKNNMENPVKITCSIANGNCTIKFLGIKENNYKVEISNVTTGSTPFAVEYQQDDSLKFGEEKVIQNGSNGYTIKSTRTVYENGNVVKTESIPSSYYIPLKKIVARNENAEEPVLEETEVTDSTETEVEVLPEDETGTSPEDEPTSPELGLETEIY